MQQVFRLLQLQQHTHIHIYTHTSTHARAKNTTNMGRLTSAENPSLIHDGPPSSSPPSPMPLFLTHDGGGTTFGYSCLDPLGRTTYGVHNAHWDEGGFWEGGIREMAAAYVGMIDRVLPEGGDILLGGKDDAMQYFCGFCYLILTIGTFFFSTSLWLAFLSWFRTIKMGRSVARSLSFLAYRKLTSPSGI